MKTFRIRFMAAAVAVLFGTLMAKAQTTDATATTAPSTAPHAMHHHRHGFRYAGFHGGFFAPYLNLSDAQKAQMKSIMQKEHATMKPFFEQLHETRQQLRQIEEGTYDDAKVRNLAVQQSQAQVELTVEQTKLRNELFQVLTPDQQAKMKQMEANRASRMQERRSQTPSSSAPASAPEQQ